MDTPVHYCSDLNFRVCSSQHLPKKMQNVLLISVTDTPPFSQETPPGSGCFCGVSISLLDMVAKVHSKKLVLTSSNLNPRRAVYENETYDRSPADLLLGLAMLSACPLSMSPVRARHFDLVTAGILRDYHILVHNRYMSTDEPFLTEVLKAFAPLAWIGLATTAAVIFFLLWVSRYVEINLLHTPATRRKPKRKIWTVCRALLDTCWELTELLLAKGDLQRRSYLDGRSLVALLWLYWSLVVTAVTAAYVTSSLTEAKPVAPFRSAAGLSESSFRPLLRLNSFLSAKDLREPLGSKSIIYDSQSSDSLFLQYAANISMTKKVAIFLDSFEKPGFSKAGFSSVATLGWTVWISTFQLPKHSPLTESVTRTVTALTQSGLTKRLLDMHLLDMYHEQQLTKFIHSISPSDTQFTLLLATVEPAFYFLVAALMLCTVSFFAEQYVNHRYTNANKGFWQIVYVK